MRTRIKKLLIARGLNHGDFKNHHDLLFQITKTQRFNLTLDSYYQ